MARRDEYERSRVSKKCPVKKDSVFMHAFEVKQIVVHAQMKACTGVHPGAGTEPAV